jgi:hypothetical protein
MSEPLSEQSNLGDVSDSESAAMPPKQIMNPCNDYAFKLAFTDPAILVPFLNCILDFKDEAAIASVINLDPTHPSAPSASPLGRHFIFYVLCCTLCGKNILIDIQNNSDPEYSDKALLGLCRLTGRADALKLQFEFQKQRTTLAQERSRGEDAALRSDIGMLDFLEGN